MMTVALKKQPQLKSERRRTRAGSPCYGIAAAALLALAGVVRAEGTTPPATFTDPVPHDIITQPYRVCDDLEELTSRINNLYRKPYDKLFDANGCPQPETIFFKDVTSGHEVMSLTRELCVDIAHADLGRPVWTVDGKKILFMGNRALIDHDGKFKKSDWQGKMYIMNADYTNQRALVTEITDDKGAVTATTDGLPGKYSILDPAEPNIAYYADAEKLFRAELSNDPKVPTKAQLIATFSTNHRKIIQAISRDRKLLIQDLNADIVRGTGQPEYMPEIHLVNLNKKPGEEGFYYHHPFDYGLPEVKGLDGKTLHDAKNNYQFHSLMFGGNTNSIGWNYGPMTQEGEFLGWGLDVTNGLDGTPKHGEITAGGGGNPFGQYESHGRFVGDSSIGLYFSGPAKANGKQIGEYGLFLRDYAANTPPVFITPGPGGHVAGGESFNPYYFAAHIQASTAQWRQRVKESDAIVYGDVREKKASVLCYTYSDVRGGTRTDRKTGQKTWSGMDNNDMRPYTAIPRPLLSRDATKVWFHSSMLMPTEDWTGIYVVVVRRPEPPVELKVNASFMSTAATVTWKPAPLAVETKGFHIYRQDGNNPAVDLTPELVPARVDGKLQTSYSFQDTKLTGNGSTYFVTTEEWSGLESDTTSNAVTVSPLAGDGTKVEDKPARTKFDTTAPPAVTGFTATREAAGQYRLKWEASPATDIRYYNVYFSAKGKPEVKQQRLIASPLKSMTSYLDWSAPTEGEGNYAITAVDRQGNESAPAFVTAK